MDVFDLLMLDHFLGREKKAKHLAAASASVVNAAHMALAGIVLIGAECPHCGRTASDVLLSTRGRKHNQIVRDFTCPKKHHWQAVSGK